MFLVMCCAVIAETQCENGYGRAHGPYMQQGYTNTRIKRVKYSNAPQRFYSRAPAGFPNHGAFSYTPPPGYMNDNDDPPYPGNPNPGNSRPKVSKRPNKEGLRDEDLQNFVRYLSKQDLDKILEYAGFNRDSERTRDPYEKQIDNRPTTDEYRNIYNSIQDTDISQKPNEDESQIFKGVVHEIGLDPKFNPYKEKNPSFNRPTNADSNDDLNPANYATDPTPSFYSDAPNPNGLDAQESAQNQITYSSTFDSSAPTNKVLSEEILPRPVNLRDDQDFEASFTNKVPVVNVDPSYQLENFGNLPLMNYNSKLDTLSSYHVPHYTVSTLT